MIMRLCFTLALLWFLVACIRPAGGPKQPGEAPPSRQQPAEESSGVPQNEDFDPLSLNDDEIAFAAFRTSVDTVTEVADTTREGPRQVSGYRVQIFAGANEQSARTVEEKARFEFTTPVYLTYDPPNYKIRLGDFTDRNEADKVRREARRKGYRGAWVVPDQIWIGLPAKPDTTGGIPDSLQMPEVLPEIQENAPQ
jgi:hypothetical protein